MAGLWYVLKCGSGTDCCDVLPLCGCAPARALFSGHRRNASMDPAWVGPLYWIQRAGGHRRHISPRAADRSGRRTPPPGLCARPAMGRACTERVHACPRVGDLAENRPLPLWAITPPTMGVEGASGVLGERTGGAFESQIPSPVRVFGRFRVSPQRRVSRAQAVPPPCWGASFMAAWCSGSYGALVVHSLWRRRCGGWWDGAAPPREHP